LQRDDPFRDALGAELPPVHSRAFGVFRGALRTNRRAPPLVAMAAPSPIRYGRFLYTAGLPEREISEIMGWEEQSVSRIIRRYVDRQAAIKERIRKLNQARR
jgi:hypothetical protein